MAPNSDEPTIDHLLAEYFGRVDRGEPVDPEEFIEAHTGHADQLREYFDNEGIWKASSSDSGPSVTGPHREHVAREAPREIGPYRLLQRIGEGGMGTVWIADQEHPVRRRVALKLIKEGAADKQTIARFEAERQALAMMDHPNIAKVLDAGTVDAGSPYFVMELVQGDPITKYCDINKLTPNERLELLVQACDAVQHAHHKGIVHRDLKPSNILVCIYDGKPVVKVIDFGLAKALEHQIKLTDKTVFTEFGRVLGTVQYMSPEQARLDAIDIDTRTDVYSLGVILYELLVGSTPIEKEALRDIAVLKVLETVREQDPPRPSHRLTSSIEKQHSISAQRQIQLSKLQKILRGELDWITMCALEKDRTRRYATPNDFAEDVRRYLTGNAVVARPPTVGYRLRKFSRRNWGAVATVGTILTLLTAGIVGTSLFAYREQIARKRSDKILQIVADSFRSVDPKAGADADMSAKDVLLNAKERLDGSNLDNAGKRRLLDELGRSFSGIGEYSLAIDVAEQCLDLSQAELGPDHPSTLIAMNNLADAYGHAGQTEEAIELHERTLQLMKTRLGEDHPDTLMSMGNLASGYGQAGRTAEAIELYEQTLQLQQAKLGANDPDTLSSMNNLAGGYQRAGRTAEAIELYERALQLQQAKLGPDHPYTLNSMNNLASGYRQAGRTAEAIELLEETIHLKQSKLGSDHPATLGSMGNLAIGYCQAGRMEEGIELFERILQLQQAKLGPDHPDTLMSMGNLALGYRKAGRTTKAIELYERGLQLMQSKLGPDHPATLMSMSNLADAYGQAGRTAEAIELFEQTLQLQQAKLGPDHPSTLMSMGNLATAYRQAGRTAEAIELHEQTLELMQSKLGPDHFDSLIAMNNLASAYGKAGRTEEAIELHERTLQLMKTKLGDDHPDTLTSMNNLANRYRDAGRIDDAIELYEEALQLRKAKLGPDHADTLTTLRGLVWTLAQRVGTTERLNDQLMRDMRHACQVSQDGNWINTLAVAEYRVGHFEDAIDAANDSIAKMPPPIYPINFAVLAMSHFKLGQTEHASAFREKLQEAMQSDAFRDDKDCQTFADEVEDVVCD